MVRFDLPVEEPVLLNPGVAVHCPQQPEVVLAALVRLVTEHCRSGPTMDLYVASR